MEFYFAILLHISLRALARIYDSVIVSFLQAVLNEDQVVIMGGYAERNEVTILFDDL